MKEKILKACSFLTYWSIIIMPFTVAIAPAIANIFIGFFAAGFLAKKLIKKEGIFIDRYILFPFILFFILSAVSFANTVSYSASWHGLLKIIKYMLIFIACSEEIRDKKHLQRIIISICCGVSLASIDAIWQLIFGYDFIRGNVSNREIGLIRPSASFSNCNILGIYLGALTPLIIGLVLFYYKGKNMILMLLPALLGVAGIYLTLSRGSGLAIYAAIMFLCVIGRKRNLIILLLVVLIIFPFVMPKNIKQWAKDEGYNPLVFMCNKDRISIYSNTINMIKDHPFIGVGVNTFSRNYAKYKTEEAERYAHTIDTTYAHNIYLHMAGEVGLLGLSAFLCFLFSIFWQAVKVLRKLEDNYLKAINLGITACLMAFLINGLTETSLYYSRVVMIFWYLIGMSLAMGKFAKVKEIE